MALAAVLTTALFRMIGPKRTRLVAQIVAAVIGAGFVIGLQLAAIVSHGTLSRLAVLASEPIVAHRARRRQHGVVAGARAARRRGGGRRRAGRWHPSAGCRHRDGGAAFRRLRDRRRRRRSGGHARSRAARTAFRSASPAAMLRRKEWTLLRRDPWLMSQTLMQLLYLLPPAFLLWRGFGGEGASQILLVPVLVMAAGQLAGGLAWLAISGEDAPELVATAPLSAGRILRAKIEAVMGSILMVFAPFIVALALVSPF